MAYQLALSPSKLQDFENCNRLYFYRYVSKPIPEPKSREMIIGSLVHYALELFHHAAKGEPMHRLEAFMPTLYKIAVSKMAQDYPEFQPSEQDLQEIKVMLLNYLAFVKPKLHELKKVKFMEQPFDISFEGVKIRGRIDRVDVLDAASKSWRVVDYKTGRMLPHQQESDQYAQLFSYAWWILSEIDPAARVLGQYVFLKHVDAERAPGVIPQIWSLESAREQMQRYVKMASVIQKAYGDKEKFARNTEFKWCGNCVYKQVCK